MLHRDSAVPCVWVLSLAAVCVPGCPRPVTSLGDLSGKSLCRWALANISANRAGEGVNETCPRTSSLPPDGAAGCGHACPKPHTRTSCDQEAPLRRCVFWLLMNSVFLSTFRAPTKPSRKYAEFPHTPSSHTHTRPPWVSKDPPTPALTPPPLLPALQPPVSPPPWCGAFPETLTRAGAQSYGGSGSHCRGPISHTGRTSSRVNETVPWALRT